MGWIPGPSGDIVHVGGGKGGTSSAGERNPQVGGGQGGVAVEIRTYLLRSNTGLSVPRALSVCGVTLLLYNICGALARRLTTAQTLPGVLWGI